MAVKRATNRTSWLQIYTAWMMEIHDEWIVHMTSYIHDIKRHIPYLTWYVQTPTHALYTWPKIDSVTTSLQLWPPVWAANTKSHAYRTKQGWSTDTHSRLDSYGYKLVKPFLLYVFNSRSSFLIIFHGLFCILLLFAPHQSRGKWLYMDVSQMILIRIHPYFEKMTGKEGQGLKRLE